MGFFGYVGVAVDGYVYGSYRKVFAVVGYGEFEAFEEQELFGQSDGREGLRG